MSDAAPILLTPEERNHLRKVVAIWRESIDNRETTAPIEVHSADAALFERLLTPPAPWPEKRPWWHLFHRWTTVLDTGVNVYELCPVCGKRQVRLGLAGWQPVDHDWLKTGRFTVLKTPPPRI